MKKNTVTRKALADCLADWRAKGKEAWLADWWQECCYPFNGYNERPNVWAAGVKYLKRSPIWSKYFDAYL